MYERFYNLRERPFSLSPDPDYLYPSRIHSEALSYLRYGLDGYAGFIVVTGEIGSGKTTLLQTALRGLDHQTSISRLVNTQLDTRELIEAIMLDFGLEPSPAQSKPYLLRELARFLVAQRRAGRLVLLVIDEAQNLTLSALEEVRMLSNLETEKSKLIQIALVGQPSLRETLRLPELQQLQQRVGVSYHLRSLDQADTAAYITHRLHRASISTPVSFPRPVCDLIHWHSLGLPRSINIIADAILLFAYGDGQRTITIELARDAIGELESTGVIATIDAASSPATPPDATTDDRAGVLTSVPSRIHPKVDAAAGSTDAVSGAAPRQEPIALPSRRVTPPRPPQQRIVMPPSFLQVPERHPSVWVGIWDRLKRSLFSAGKPAFED